MANPKKKIIRLDGINKLTMFITVIDGKQIAEIILFRKGMQEGKKLVTLYSLPIPIGLHVTTI